MDSFDFNDTKDPDADSIVIANGGGLGFQAPFNPGGGWDPTSIANGGGLGFDGFDPGYDEFVIANGGGLGFDGF